MESSKFKLVLGSQSPRRKELLSWLDLPFEVMIADIDESSDQLEPIEVAKEIAYNKAMAIIEKSKDQNEKDAFFVITSDTIVVLDGKIYGKPKDVVDARKILSELSDRTHQVITAVCFSFLDQENKLKTHSFYDATEVTFDEITDELMDLYLKTKDSLDKAGAYGIQGPSLTFISSIKGSYSNVVGFPLDRVVKELQIILGDNWRSRFE